MLDITKTKQKISFISDREIEAVQQPLNKASTLPPQVYTSPEVYALEEQNIFRQQWLCIGRADQIPNPGDYFSLDLLGEPLVATRDFNGNIQVLSNVCRHRYMKLVEGAGNAKYLACPYHLWNYSLDGQLIAAPKMERAENFHKADVCLPKLRFEIWEGFIFINFDRNARPLAPQLATLSQLIANYQLSEMRIVETLIYDCQCNWKQVVENYIDTSHHQAVHQSTINRFAPTDGTVDMDSDGPYNICRIEVGTYDSQSGLPILEGLKDWQRTNMVLIHLYPFNLISLSRERFSFWQLKPISVGRLTVKINYCIPASSLANSEYTGALKKVVREFSSRVNEEDMVVNEGVWKGLQSSFSQPGRLSHLDKRIWEFNQWWLEQMMSGASEL